MTRNMFLMSNSLSKSLSNSLPKLMQFWRGEFWQPRLETCSSCQIHCINWCSFEGVSFGNHDWKHIPQVKFIAKKGEFWQPEFIFTELKEKWAKRIKKTRTENAELARALFRCDDLKWWLDTLDAYDGPVWVVRPGDGKLKVATHQEFGGDKLEF